MTSILAVRLIELQYREKLPTPKPVSNIVLQPQLIHELTLLQKHKTTAKKKTQNPFLTENPTPERASERSPLNGFLNEWFSERKLSQHA
jgi:hypothetical protein